MPEGRTHTTLAGPRRCPWCAAPIGFRDEHAWGRYRTCRLCADLERLAREHYGPPPLRDELRQAVKRG